MIKKCNPDHKCKKARLFITEGMEFFQKGEEEEDIGVEQEFEEGKLLVHGPVGEA